ncbi:hypothetical protein VIGAN_11125800, partial [Vigna angularis var. angularis]
QPLLALPRYCSLTAAASPLLPHHRRSTTDPLQICFVQIHRQLRRSAPDLLRLDPPPASSIRSRSAPSFRLFVATTSLLRRRHLSFNTAAPFSLPKAMAASHPATPTHDAISDLISSTGRDLRSHSTRSSPLPVQPSSGASGGHGKPIWGLGISMGF